MNASRDLSCFVVFVFLLGFGCQDEKSQPGSFADQTFLYETSSNPLTVGEFAKLKSFTSLDNGDAFGYALTTESDFIVVGAPNSVRNYNGPETGRIYIFKRVAVSPDVWQSEKSLFSSDAEDGDDFGYDLDLSAETIVVGAPGNDANGNQSGSAYVYERDLGGTANWGERKRLLPADLGVQNYFGRAVVVDGDTIAVAAPLSDLILDETGAVYIFGRNQGGTDNWGMVKKITPSEIVEDMHFGHALALEGDTLVVGAPGYTDLGTERGAFYVFDRNAGGIENWGQIALRTDPDVDNYSLFGSAIDISGDTVAVGAYLDHGTYSDEGSVIIFSRDLGGANNWGHLKKIRASDPEDYTHFGWSVAIHQDSLIVGSYTFNTWWKNKAYLYDRNKGGPDNWGETSNRLPTEQTASMGFGNAVAIDDYTAIVGAREYDEGSRNGIGAAFVFHNRPNGAPCSDDTLCQNLFCVDGVCCDSACGSNAESACGVCSVAAGATVDGVCQARSSAHVCRASAGSCDPLETCDGANTDCPGDSKSIDECRAAAGACDIAEFCDGATDDCPVDVKATVECRPVAGDCDSAEFCDGLNDDCPADAKETSLCRAAVGPCDLAEVCDGASNDCPLDEKSTALCRSAAGPCDVAEFCSGSNDYCPSDLKSFDVCRLALGICDREEVCDGLTNDCPADTKLTSMCRPTVGTCDLPDYCDGVANDCPVDRKSTALCRNSAGPCDSEEFCNGAANDCPPDSKSTNLCRSAAGACDQSELCDGISNACPADAKLSGICRPALGACDREEVCDGLTNDCPADTKLTSMCRPPAGTCDLPEICDGAANSCPVDQKSTALCRVSAGPCDSEEFCNGAANECPPDSKSTNTCRPAVGACDQSEVCDGVANTCPADVKSSGVCREAQGDCDLAEACDGISDVCPSDQKSNALCRSAAGPCDIAEFCDGVRDLCPIDTKSNAICRASVGSCDSAEYCSGMDDECPADGKSTSVCRAAKGVCDEPEHCDGVSDTCGGDLKSQAVCRPAAGACDIEEICDGVDDYCQPDGKSTEECRPSAGDCDLVENCDGLNNDCPVDTKSNAICRVSQGVCDIAEICDGNADSCPSDVVHSSSFLCRNAVDSCDAAETCDGTNFLCPPNLFFESGEDCDDEDQFTENDICILGGVCQGEWLLGSCGDPLGVDSIPFSDQGSTLDTMSSVSIYGANCERTRQYSPDEIYELALEEGANIQITVTPAGNFDPAIRIIETCNEGQDCLESMDQAGPGEPENLVVEPVESETVFLVIEGSVDTDQGTYDIDIDHVPTDTDSDSTDGTDTGDTDTGDMDTDTGDTDTGDMDTDTGDTETVGENDDTDTADTAGDHLEISDSPPGDSEETKAASSAESCGCTTIGRTHGKSIIFSLLDLLLI